MNERSLIGGLALLVTVLAVPQVYGAGGRELAGATPDGTVASGVRTSATVSLNPTAQYYFPGQTVVVNVTMTNASGVVTGGQFFLAYNTSKLQFESMVAGDDPFVQELFEVLGVGAIDYAVGVLPGQSGTANDTIMAVIRFNALAGVCATADLVSFRQHDPPSRLTDAAGDPVTTSTVNMSAITIDGTLPSIICPANVTVECTDSTLPAATGTATATDNCDGSPVITYSDNVTPSACVGNWEIARTWQAADDTGNLKSCLQTIAVRDTTDPVITCPANITTNAEAGTCEAALDPGAATATDNCDPASVIVGNRDDGLPLVGDYPSGAMGVTWEATDCAGNSDVCVQTVTVQDVENPSITCPADITVNADAGGLTAYVNVPPPPFIQDNCGILAVANDKNGSPNASDTYGQGPTTVTWTVTDVSGNTAQCTHTVTVRAFSDLVVSVQFSPTVAPVLTRCITFELYKCGTAQHATVSQPINFTYGLALEKVLEVPAFNGAYDCITARDRLHTLRRTSGNFRIVGTRYVASFTGNVDTGGDWLIGGNLNDDLYIDILDFGVLSMEWGKSYDSDGNSVPDGHTTCSTAYPHADITGNGLVNLGDFTFIQIHFLKLSEANCCGLRGEGAAGPVTSIAVADLPAEYADMAAGDLNCDGMLDAQDIAEWMNGGRPDPGLCPHGSKASTLENVEVLP